MPISLYDATVPTLMQITRAVRGLIDKAEAFCAEHGHDEASLCTACLAEDMRPFAYQILSVGTHSVGAIAGVRAGTFSPNMAEPPQGFDAQRAYLDGILADLETISPEEMESFIGKPVLFSIPAMNLAMDFVGEQFLLSFSQPNFFFHATTAYDILRHKGVPVGKRDFLGAMRIATAA